VCASHWRILREHLPQRYCWAPQITSWIHECAARNLPGPARLPRTESAALCHVTLAGGAEPGRVIQLGRLVLVLKAVGVSWGAAHRDSVVDDRARG